MGVDGMNDEIEAWADSLPKLERHLVALYGLGEGPEVRALLDRLAPDDRLIVCEPDDRMLERFRSNNADLEGRRFWRVRDWVEFKNLFMQIGGWENFTFAEIPAYTAKFRPQVEEFKARALREIRAIQADQATTYHFARQWQENVLRNLPALSRAGSVVEGFDAFKGVPALLVAAGPSLHAQLPLLQSAKGHALVIATQTTNRLFEKIGFKPDLVMSFDGGYPNFHEHFDGVDLGDVPLVFDPVTHWEAVAAWRGPKVGMLVHPANQWLEDKLGVSLTGLWSGPSISCTMMHAAWRFGCEPLIFVGQDMAYGRGGRKHISGTHASESWDSDVTLEQVVALVEDQSGGHLLTNGAMLTFLHWIEEVIRNLPDCPTVVNASGGARISGTLEVSLEDALARYCTTEVDINGRIAKLCEPKPHQSGRLRRHLLRSAVALDKLRPHLDDCVRQATQLLKKIEVPMEPLKETLAGFATGDRVITKYAKYLHVIHYALRPLLGSLERAVSYTADEPLKVARENWLFYKVLQEAVAENTPKVWEAAKRLEEMK
mgnify:FL=1